MFRSRFAATVALMSLAFLLPAAAGAQQSSLAPTLSATLLSPGLYSLETADGNVAVSIGSDGVVLIGSLAAGITDRALGMVAAITPDPVRFVVSTGGPLDAAAAGVDSEGMVIVSRGDDRTTISADELLATVPPPTARVRAAELPIVTVASDATFMVNDEEIHAFRVDDAHAVGDVIVYLTGSGMMHMGGTYIADGFPLIDTAAGGTIDGLIAAVGKAIDEIGPGTNVMPGHGTVTGQEDLVVYRDALVAILKEVEGILAEGHPNDHLLDFRPARPWAQALRQERSAEDAFVLSIVAGIEAR